MAEVLIVSYGEPAALEPLRTSLRNQTRAPSAIRVWHNGPANATSGENLGFGEGINRLAAQARDQVAIVANPDSTLDPRCVEVLEDALLHSDATIAAAALYGTDGRVNAYGQKLTFDLVGVNTDRGRAEPAAGASYLGPSGALFAIHLGRWGQRPLFPRSFFLYLEDVALWLKARSGGHRIVFCPEARAVHAWSGSTGQRSAMKLYHVERNRLWLSRVLRGYAATVLTLPFTAARYAAYGGPRAATPGMASALGRALRDGLLGPLPPDVVEYFRGVRTRRSDFAPLRDQLRNPVGPDEG